MGCNIIDFPVWRWEEDSWTLYVGDKHVAGLMPDKGGSPWMTVVYADSPYPDYGCDFVEFDDLADAKAFLIQWWCHAVRGVGYSVRHSGNCS